MLRAFVLAVCGILVGCILVGCGGGGSPFVLDGAAVGDSAVTDAARVDAGNPGDSAVVRDSAVAPDSGIVRDTAVVDSNVPLSPVVSPTCIDGMVSETNPNPNPDIASLPFSSSDVQTYVLAVLDARYPYGATIVRGCLASRHATNCVRPWIPDTSTRAAVNRSLTTVVHEGGHLFDLANGGFGTYEINASTRLACAMGEPPSTFARSRLVSDSFQSHITACPQGQNSNCDTYARTYLVENGASQGFASVIEESFQYVNSLATAYAFADQYPNGQRVSERDGILAFLWYVERYLYLARTSEPAIYASITGNECWRRAILTLWGRAWRYLELTRGQTRFEILAPRFMQEVMAPELLQEIQRVRVLQGCS